MPFETNDDPKIGKSREGGGQDSKRAKNYCREIPEIRTRNEFRFHNDNIRPPPPPSLPPPPSAATPQKRGIKYFYILLVGGSGGQFSQNSYFIIIARCSRGTIEIREWKSVQSILHNGAPYRPCTHLINGKHDCFYLSICSLFGEHVRRHSAIFIFSSFFFNFSIFSRFLILISLDCTLHIRSTGIQSARP